MAGIYRDFMKSNSGVRIGGLVRNGVGLEFVGRGIAAFWG